jgi:hypothetical protein
VETGWHWYWSDTTEAMKITLASINAAGVGGSMRKTGNPVPVLNDLGAAGWEVVGVLPPAPGITFDYGLLLKRPVEEPIDD